MSTIPANVSLIATAPSAEQPARRLPRLVGWSAAAVVAGALWVGLFELVRLAF
jgi:hypothetical protein